MKNIITSLQLLAKLSSSLISIFSSYCTVDGDIHSWLHNNILTKKTNVVAFVSLKIYIVDTDQYFLFR